MAVAHDVAYRPILSATNSIALQDRYYARIEVSIVLDEQVRSFFEH